MEKSCLIFKMGSVETVLHEDKKLYYILTKMKNVGGLANTCYTQSYVELNMGNFVRKKPQAIATFSARWEIKK